MYMYVCMFQHDVSLTQCPTDKLPFETKCDEALSEEDFDPSAASLWSIRSDGTFQPLLSSLLASYSLACEHLLHSSASPEHQTLGSRTLVRWLAGWERANE